MAQVEVRTYKGRPTIFVDGEPRALPTYSPIGWRRGPFERNTPWFFRHRMGAYFLAVPRLKGGGYWDSPFWMGDRISAEPPLHRECRFASGEMKRACTTAGC